MFNKYMCWWRNFVRESVLPTVRTLLEEGHFVTLVTNGTMTKRFDEIITWDKALLSHLFYKIFISLFRDDPSEYAGYLY